MPGTDAVAIPLGLQRAARRTSREVGRLTSSLRSTPDFLIVGAQRCGTTTLYKALTRHPAVLPAVLHKGVHYFDTGYDNGPGWYRAHFPLLSTKKRVERRTGVRPLTGESSPYYMFHPCAPARISRDLPHVRLLVLLRDPVERAYSAHAHESARGFETESFERALELEPVRLDGEEQRLLSDPSYVSATHQHNAYVTRGHYIDQLLRLEELFGRERMHVLDSHDLFDRPESVVPGLLGFLGLPPSREILVERHNARPRTRLDPSLRARLEDHFAPSDERLAAWLGRTPGWRRT